MFQLGDLVCYPMHGIGTIESITEQTILGDKQLFYVLRFNQGRMTVMVPVDGAEQVGLRYLIDCERCRQVIDYLASDEVAQESNNWNQRYRDNLDKLRMGDVFQVAAVVKCLVRRDQRKGLSPGERKMYLTARNVLLAELCAAGGKSEEELLPLLEAEKQS